MVGGEKNQERWRAKRSTYWPEQKLDNTHIMEMYINLTKNENIFWKCLLFCLDPNKENMHNRTIHSLTLIMAPLRSSLISIKHCSWLAGIYYHSDSIREHKPSARLLVLASRHVPLQRGASQCDQSWSLTTESLGPGFPAALRTKQTNRLYLQGIFFSLLM